MAKIRKASDEERIAVDLAIEEELHKHISLKDALRKTVGDYFEIKTYYFDEQGRFISAKEYRERFKKGEPVKKKNVFYLKTDMPEYGLKTGDKLPDELFDPVVQTVREEVRRHNAAVTIMLRDSITYEEARKLVDEAFDLFEEGIIDPDELHEVLSP